MRAFLGNTPFAIIGALGVFSFVSGLMDLADGVQDWVDAWRVVTRPIWEFLFGWAFEWLDWQFPWWLKDYLTLGLIHFGMYARGSGYIREIIQKYKNQKFIILLYEEVILSLISIIFWPMFVWAAAIVPSQISHGHDVLVNCGWGLALQL